MMIDAVNDKVNDTRKMAVAGIFLTLAFSAATFGLTLGATEFSKESHVDNMSGSSLVVDTSGRPVQSIIGHVEMNMQESICKVTENEDRLVAWLTHVEDYTYTLDDGSVQHMKVDRFQVDKNDVTLYGGNSQVVISRALCHNARRHLLQSSGGGGYGGGNMGSIGNNFCCGGLGGYAPDPMPICCASGMCDINCEYSGGGGSGSGSGSGVCCDSEDSIEGITADSDADASLQLTYGGDITGGGGSFKFDKLSEKSGMMKLHGMCQYTTENNSQFGLAGTINVVQDPTTAPAGDNWKLAGTVDLNWQYSEFHLGVGATGDFHGSVSFDATARYMMDCSRDEHNGEAGTGVRVQVGPQVSWGSAGGGDARAQGNIWISF